MDSFEDFEFITLQDVAEATCEQPAGNCTAALVETRADPAVRQIDPAVSNPDQPRKLETGSISQPAVALNEQHQPLTEAADLLQTLQEPKVTVVPICMNWPAQGRITLNTCVPLKVTPVTCWCLW